VPLNGHPPLSVRSGPCTGSAPPSALLATGLHCCRPACEVSHASRYPVASQVTAGSALPALVQLFARNAARSVFCLAYAYPACAGFVGRDSKAPHYQQNTSSRSGYPSCHTRATALCAGQCGFPPPQLHGLSYSAAPVRNVGAERSTFFRRAPGDSHPSRPSAMPMR